MKTNKLLKNDYLTAIETITSRLPRGIPSEAVMPHISASAQYIEQEILLQSQGETAFIAHYFVNAICGNTTIYSEATWTEGIVSLIPQTDYLSFPGNIKLLKDGGASMTMYAFHVPWNDVVRIVGYRMERTALSPIRFRLDTFPNQSELAALKKCEIYDIGIGVQIVNCGTIEAILSKIPTSELNYNDYPTISPIHIL